MTNTSIPATLSCVAASLWLGSIVLLHVIKPELDPKTRMVSEYACGPVGWLMQLAFWCMGISCWALAIATWTSLPPLGPALLLICGLGFVGAGVFVTDPVSLAEQSRTRNGQAHVLFAFATMLLFPIMATVVVGGLAGSATGLAIGPWLWVLSGLTWIGFISFVAAALHLGRRGSAPLGWFERFLVLTYSAWLIAIAAVLIA